MPRPHDLLFLRHPDAFDACACATRPGWLDALWLEQAPVVVRRAAAGPERVAVGARGLQRNERCAGHIALADIARRITPRQLAHELLRAPGRVEGFADALPCIAALLALAPRLRDLDLDWGPAGGAGFWLASGLPVLRPTSDLDLLVRSPQPLSPALTAELCTLHDYDGCRIDIQIDTGVGGFALMEYARGGKTMLKTEHGPQLVDNPWEPQPQPQSQPAASEAA
ncbi:malonate decarboxylase holo-ACP synthase [Massilia sp. 2TAF26]